MGYENEHDLHTMILAHPNQRDGLYLVSSAACHQLLRLVIAALLAVQLLGCGIPMGRLANRNRDDFPNLRKGMTRAEVVEIMGTRGGVAPQPWRSEASHDSTGAALEVWYYLMEHPYELGERKYLSPIVLQNGIVIGIGWDFLLKGVGRHFTDVGRRNESRIRRLKAGMTKEETLIRMREDKDYGIPQPYRTVTHHTAHDGLIEILYYLVAYPTGATDWRFLGPVVLKEGIVVGTGWDLTREIAKQNDIEDVGWWLCGDHGEKRRLVTAECASGPCRIELCSP